MELVNWRQLLQPHFWIPMSVAALILAWVAWWVLPIRLAKRNLPGSPREKQLEQEDLYRKAIGQALGLVSVLAASYYALDNLVESRRAAQIAQYNVGIKGLASKEVGERVGSAFALEALSKEVPEWKENIMLTISSALGQYSGEPWLHREATARFEADEPSGEACTFAAVARPDVLLALRVIARAGLHEMRYPLSGGSLRGAAIPHAELSRADLSSSDLSGSDLYGSNLFGANMTNVNLSGSNMASAELSHARLVLAKLNPGCNYAVPNLQRGHPVATQLANAKLRSATLDRAELHGADLKRAVLDDAQLVEAQFHGAEFDKDTSFRRSTLIGADFSCVRAGSSPGEKPEPASADFRSHINPDGSPDLNHITLVKGGKFVGANLRYARFNHADLSEANFRAANLEGADFQGASVDFGALEQAYLCKTLRPDGQRDDRDCGRRWVIPEECLPRDDTVVKCN